MVLKLHGLALSANVTPIMGLLAENGIENEFVQCNIMAGENKTPEYLKMNPMHCIPTINDDGYTMWESKAILRYIANKHSLESWYPTDAKKRGVCDLALDFHANTFAALVGRKVLYPAAGFAGPLSESEQKEAEKQWNDDVWPAMQHLLAREGGPLLGGAKPSIADLAFVALLGAVFAKCPDSFVCKTEGLKAYFSAAKAALPKYSEWMAVSEGFFKAK